MIVVLNSEFNDWLWLYLGEFNCVDLYSVKWKCMLVVPWLFVHECELLLKFTKK